MAKVRARNKVSKNDDNGQKVQVSPEETLNKEILDSDAVKDETPQHVPDEMVIPNPLHDTVRGLISEIRQNKTGPYASHISYGLKNFDFDGDILSFSYVRHNALTPGNDYGYANTANVLCHSCINIGAFPGSVAEKAEKAVRVIGRTIKLG